MSKAAPSLLHIVQQTPVTLPRLHFNPHQYWFWDFSGQFLQTDRSENVFSVHFEHSVKLGATKILLPVFKFCRAVQRRVFLRYYILNSTPPVMCSTPTSWKNWDVLESLLWLLSPYHPLRGGFNISWRIHNGIASEWNECILQKVVFLSCFI